LIDKLFSIYQTGAPKWPIHPLGYLCAEVKKKNKLLLEDNLLSLSYGKIKRKDIDSSEGLLPESFDGYNIVENGDTVLRLTDLQNDKRSLRTGLATETGIITSAYVTIRPKLVDPSWLYYTLHSYDIQKVFYSLGSGLRQSMKYEDLKSLAIAVPNKDEQLRILQYLDSKSKKIDSLIALKKLQMKSLVEERVSNITRIVSGGFESASEIGKLNLEKWMISCPKSWKLSPLKRTVFCSNSGIWGEEPGSLDIDVPVSTTAHLTRDNQFLFEEMPIRSVSFKDFNNYNCKPGDLVVVKSSGSAENIMSGKVSVVLENSPDFLFSNFLMRLRPINTQYSTFLQAFLSCNIGVERVKRMVSTTTYPNLKVEEYLNSIVPVPPDNELGDISKELKLINNDYMRRMKLLSKSISVLTDFKSAMVVGAVSGQFEVIDGKEVA
jgi:type I restriction enzyme S subunit